MFSVESPRMRAIRQLMDAVQKVADASCDVIELLEGGDETLAHDLRETFNEIGERVSDAPFRRLAFEYQEAAIAHASEMFLLVVRAAERQAPIVLEPEYRVKTG